jgi:hypothetical protein
MTRKLFVANFPYSTTPEELEQLFAPHGPVVAVKIATDRETGRSRGFGFIEMETEEACENAIRKMDGFQMAGVAARAAASVATVAASAARVAAVVASAVRAAALVLAPSVVAAASVTAAASAVVLTVAASAVVLTVAASVPIVRRAALRTVVASASAPRAPRVRRAAVAVAIVAASTTTGTDPVRVGIPAEKGGYKPSLFCVPGWAFPTQAISRVLPRLRGRRQAAALPGSASAPRSGTARSRAGSAGGRDIRAAD